MSDPASTVQYGTAYIYGIGDTSPTHMTVTSESMPVKANINETVHDEYGRTVHVRMDDFTEEISIEGFIKGTADTIPALLRAGSTITWRTKHYIINENEYRGEAKGFAKYSIKGIRYISTGIPAAPATGPI